MFESEDEFDSLAKKYGVTMPKAPARPAVTVSEMLAEMRGGTSAQESGGNTKAVNPHSNALGEHQVMPANVPAWTRKYYGKELSSEEFKNNREAQRAVFDGEMGKYLEKALPKANGDKTVAKRMASAAWYGGERNMHLYDDPRPQVYKGHKYPSFREYTSKVISKGASAATPGTETDFSKLSAKYFNSEPQFDNEPDFDNLAKKYGISAPETTFPQNQAMQPGQPGEIPPTPEQTAARAAFNAQDLPTGKIAPTFPVNQTAQTPELPAPAPAPAQVFPDVAPLQNGKVLKKVEDLPTGAKYKDELGFDYVADEKGIRRANPANPQLELKGENGQVEYVQHDDQNGVGKGQKRVISLKDGNEYIATAKVGKDNKTSFSLVSENAPAQKQQPVKGKIAPQLGQPKTAQTAQKPIETEPQYNFQRTGKLPLADGGGELQYKPEDREELKDGEFRFSDEAGNNFKLNPAADEFAPETKKPVAAKIAVTSDADILQKGNAGTFNIDLSKKEKGISATDYLNREALRQKAAEFGITNQEIDDFIKSVPQKTLYDDLTPDEVKTETAVPVSIPFGTINSILQRRTGGNLNEIHPELRTKIQMDSAMTDEGQAQSAQISAERAAKEELRASTDKNLSQFDTSTMKVALGKIWDKPGSLFTGIDLDQAEKDKLVDGLVEDSIRSAGSAREANKIAAEYAQMGGVESTVKATGEFTKAVLKFPASFAKTAAWAEDGILFLREKGIYIPTLTTTDVLNAADWVWSKTLGLPEQSGKTRETAPLLLARAIEKALPEDPKMAQTVLGKISAAGGNAAAFMILGAATGGGTWGSALLGVGAQIGEQYDEAKKAGLSRERQLLGGLAGIPLGASEALGFKFGKFGQLLENASAGKFSNVAKRFVNRVGEVGSTVARETPEEFFQELGQTFGSELVNSALKNSALTKEDFINGLAKGIDSAKYAAVAGGGMSGAISTAQQIGEASAARQNRLSEVEVIDDETTNEVSESPAPESAATVPLPNEKPTVGATVEAEVKAKGGKTETKFGTVIEVKKRDKKPDNLVVEFEDGTTQIVPARKAVVQGVAGFITPKTEKVGNSADKNTQFSDEKVGSPTSENTQLSTNAPESSNTLTPETPEKSYTPEEKQTADLEHLEMMRRNYQINVEKRDEAEKNARIAHTQQNAVKVGRFRGELNQRNENLTREQSALDKLESEYAKKYPAQEIELEAKPLPAPAQQTGDFPKSAVTPSGTRVKYRGMVIDESDILTSFDEGFPKSELQPRNTDRKASREKIVNNAANLDVTLMDDSPVAGDGAPKVYPVTVDGKTKYIAVTRNHGVESIREAIRTYPEKAKEYADFARGKDSATGAKNPVYVHEISRDEIPDLAKFAVDANVGAQRKMSDTEQAETDAKLFTSGLMSKFVASEDGAIHAGANRDFIKGFLEKIVDRNEHGAVQTETGELSQTGVRRIKNAIFARAFGGSKAGMTALARMAESTNDNVKNVTNALLAKSGAFADLRQAITDGKRLKNLDITSAIAKAAEKFSEIKADSGQTVELYLQQDALFGKETTGFQDSILKVFDKYGKNSKAIRTIFDNFIDASNALGDPNQTDLMGNAPKADAFDVFAAAVETYEEKNNVQTGDGLFGNQTAAEPQGSEQNQETDSEIPAAAAPSRADEIRREIDKYDRILSQAGNAQTRRKATEIKMSLMKELGALEKEATLAQIENSNTALKHIEDLGDEPLAPNGKRSNLSEHLYNLVRTENFKKFFGDWESLAVRNQYRKTETTVLSGKEIADFQTGGDIAAFRDNAKEYAAQSVVGTYKVQALGGKNVEIRRRGIKHALARFSAEDKIRAVAGLPELLENGVLLASEPDKSGRPLSVHHLIAPLTIGKNEYVARLVVREDVNGTLFYDHDLSDIKNLAALSKLSRAPEGVGGIETQQDIPSLVEKVFSVNENDVSKVVDSNGEPMPVYHGSKSDVEIFNKENIGGFWFSATPDYANELAAIKQNGNAAANITPVFLNLRNFDVDKTPSNNFSDDNYEKPLIEKAKNEGKDGIAFQAQDEYTDTFYVAFKANQIKSIFNNGEFSLGNDSILKRAEGESTLKEFDEVKFAAPDDLIEKAETERHGDRVRVNLEAQEFVRRVMEEIDIRAGEKKIGDAAVETSFSGLFTDNYSTLKIVKILTDIADEATKAENFKTAEFAAKLSNEIDAASNEGKGTVVLYMYDSRLPHEVFHQASYLGDLARNLMTRHAKFAELKAHSVFKATADYLGRFAEYRNIEKTNPAMFDALVAEESAAYIAGGDSETLGISQDEATDYLRQWMQSYLRKNAFDEESGKIDERRAREIFANFEKVEGITYDIIGRIKESYEQHLAREARAGEPNGGSGERISGQSGQVGSRTARSDEGAFTESEPKSSSAEGTRGAAARESEVETDTRRKAAFSRILGDDVFYDGQSHSETERLASELENKKGVADAVHDALTSDAPSAESMRVVYRELQRLNDLADEHKAAGREQEYQATTGELAKLSNQIVKRQIQLGRAVEIAKTLAPLSPEHTLLVAARLKQQATGDDSVELSDKETTRIRESAKENSDTTKELARAENKIEKLKQKIKELRAGTRILNPRKVGDPKPRPLSQIERKIQTTLTKDFNKYAADLKSLFGTVDALKRIEDSGKLLAPNGKPSNLTPLQYTQVRTAEFKEWFGDWENSPENASKAVDENGEPRVMYHLTGADVESFTPSWRGLIFFADTPEGAERSAFARKGTDNIIPAFLNIKKLRGEKRPIYFGDAESKKYQEKIKSEGFDGVRIRDEAKGTIGVFASNQIKSIFNNGEFSSDSDSILKRAEGENLNDNQRDALTAIGAKILFEGLKTRENYGIEAFRGELTQLVGEKVAPFVAEIHAAAIEKITEIKKSANLKRLAYTIKTANPNLSDAEAKAEAELLIEKRLAKSKEKAQILAEHTKAKNAFARNRELTENIVFYNSDAEVVYAGILLKENKNPSINSVISAIADEFDVTLKEARDYAARAKDILTKVKYQSARQGRIAQGETLEEIEAANEIRRSQMRARMRLNKFLSEISESKNLIQRFNNDFRAKLVLNYGTQIFNAVQAITGAIPQEIFVDLVDTAIRRARKMAEKTNALDEISPEINLRDAFLPLGYIFGSNKQMAENVLSEFPEEYFRLFSGILGDVEIDGNIVERGGNKISKLIHKGFDKSDALNSRLAKITLAEMQEAHFRTAIVVSSLVQQLRASGVELKDLLEQGEVSTIKPEIIKIAVDKALRVTFAEQMQSKFLKELYQKTDRFLPVVLNPVVYARFTYTVAKSVTNAHLFGALDSKAVGGEGYTTRSFAKGIYGAAAIALAYGMLVMFNDDDDEWYQWRVMGKDQPPIDIRRFFPVSAYAFTASRIKRFVEGRPLELSELLEGWASLDLDQYNRSAGAELIKSTWNLFTNDFEKYDKLGKSSAKFAGNTASGTLRFFKPFRDIFAEIDSEERKYREYPDSASGEFLKAISSNLPVGRFWNAPVKKNPVTGEDVMQIHPIGKIVGLNFINPMFTRPKPTVAEENARALFPSEFKGGEMTKEMREASTIRRELKEAVRRGEVTAKDVEPKIKEFVASGKLTEKSADLLRKSLQMTDLQDIISKGYSPNDPKDVKKLEWLQSKMTDKEKADIAKIVGKKEANAGKSAKSLEIQQLKSGLVTRALAGEDVKDALTQLDADDRKAVNAAINQSKSLGIKSGAGLAIKEARNPDDAIEAFNNAPDAEKAQLVKMLIVKKFKAKSPESKDKYDSAIIGYKTNNK